MDKDRELVEISRFVLDMDATDGLGGLLARQFGMLEKLSDFEIQRKGVIRLFSPSGRLVTVAQHGLEPLWLNPDIAGFFKDVPVHHAAEAFVAPVAAKELAMVLPLSHERRQLGQAIILIKPGWSPGPAAVELMADLGKALSGMVSRHLLNETLLVREMELEEARTQAIRTLGTASEVRDNETGMHVMRMTNIAVAVAKAYGLPEKQKELLYITAPMHDVGKIGISDAILLKPGPLTPDEFAVMKTHTEIGQRLLEGSDPFIVAAKEIAHTHHENWDGSGYPCGLSGEEIPLLARICSIADVFDALTSVRPYKAAWPVEEAIAWVMSQGGMKFDPLVVAAFGKALPEILRIRELYREDIINPNQVLNLPEVHFSATRWVSWDQSLSVGIGVIDEHHRYLFDLANDLINVMANSLGVRHLVRVLNALVQYSQVHFEAEERMMEHYGFQGLEQQREQHRDFHEKLKELYSLLHNNPLIVPVEVTAYLKGWLVNHIKNEDTQLRSLAR